MKSRRFRRWRWAQGEDEFGQFGEPIALKLMWWGLTHLDPKELARISNRSETKKFLFEALGLQTKSWNPFDLLS